MRLPHEVRIYYKSQEKDCVNMDGSNLMGNPVLFRSLYVQFFKCNHR